MVSTTKLEMVDQNFMVEHDSEAVVVVVQSLIAWSRESRSFGGMNKLLFNVEGDDL